jgi:hypothetical protein
VPDEQTAPAAQPDRGPPDEASLTSIQVAHGALLSVYLNVVADASLAASERQWYQRYAVRRFTEAHVKGRLEELAAIYAQLECTAPSPSDRSWYEGAKAECRSFAEPLARWRAPLALTLVPLLVGGIGEAVGSISLYDPVFLFFGPLILFAAWGLVHAGGWFLDKRSLFSEHGVYDGENQLFAQLGRGKLPEFPIDYACNALAIVVALIGAAALVGDIYRLEPQGLLVLFVLVFVLFALVAQRALKGRVYE